MLADVFENCRNKCIEIYELSSDHLLSAPELEWQACLKNTEVKLELLTDNKMLMMVEKRTRGGIVYEVHKYAMANNKYIKNYGKNFQSSYLMYFDTKNFYGWIISPNLPINKFKWNKKCI